jgi:ubiquinone biosynthesis protein
MKQKLIPTPLLVPGDRPPMVIVPVEQPWALRPLKVAGELLWILRSALGLRLRGQLDGAAWGRLLRASGERLGGLWVKAGQLLAMRRDLYSTEMCDELSQLHDRAAGFPYEVVRRVLHDEIGDPDLHFREISPVPVAAASIGQVHAAWLRDGTKVAIKIKRPGIRDVFARDLVVLGLIARALHTLQPHRNWDEMELELRRIFDEEVDYRVEATRIRLMRKNLKRHKVTAPRVYEHLCGPQVLVSEFIDGVFISEYIAIKLKDPERARRWEIENGVDPKKVAQRVICSHFRQLMEDNLFHADLHPGNMLLLRNSRFALIDFGSVGELETSFRTRFTFMHRALEKGDFEKFADMYFMLVPYLPPVDYNALRGEVVRVLRDWSVVSRTRGMPYHRRSLSAVSTQISRVLVANQVPVPWDFLRISRARFTMDAAVVYLDPDLDHMGVITRYAGQAAKRRMKQTKEGASLRRLLSLAASIPPNTGEVLGEALFMHGDRLRRQARHFRVTTSKIATLFGVVFQAGMAVAFLAVGLVVLAWADQHTELLAEGALGVELQEVIDAAPQLSGTAWAFLLLAAAWGLLTLARLARRFRQTDVEAQG